MAAECVAAPVSVSAPQPTPLAGTSSGHGHTHAPPPPAPDPDEMAEGVDDERTLDEEEALAAGEHQDPRAELSSLRREGDMPLDELLALYGYSQPPPSVSVPAPAPAPAATLAPPPPPPPALTSAPTVTPVTAALSTPTPPAPPPPLPAPAPAPASSQPVSALRQLYESEPPRFLRSVSRPPSEEEDDCDYSPEEEDWKKTIMVGSDYQAWIPEGLCSYDDALPYENEDKLLWDPGALSEPATESYMGRARALAPQPTGVAALPAGEQLRDDEQALYLLQQCGHNVEEALRRRRISVADAPVAPAGLWSEEECRNFENGLKAHGKDFHLIHQHKVRTRSVGELVQFYYIWKKTERHDIFANKARLEKKKYTLHPGHTDYMDRFLEEQDGGGRDSPGVRGAPEAPPDPLAVGAREVFSELNRNSPATSRSPDTDREASSAI